jgi:hypothetical protein
MSSIRSKTQSDTEHQQNISHMISTAKSKPICDIIVSSPFLDVRCAAWTCLTRVESIVVVHAAAMAACCGDEDITIFCVI